VLVPRNGASAPQEEPVPSQDQANVCPSTGCMLDDCGVARMLLVGMCRNSRARSYCRFGPDVRSLIVSVFLISVPAVLFCIFVAQPSSLCSQEASPCSLWLSACCCL